MQRPHDSWERNAKARGNRGIDVDAREPRHCYCYIVECADGSFYTGWTTDPNRRIEAHNAGRGSRYTRARRPVRLVHLEPQADVISAMKRERAIKRMTRARKKQLFSPSAVKRRRSERKKREHGAGGVIR